MHNLSALRQQPSWVDGVGLGGSPEPCWLPWAGLWLTTTRAHSPLRSEEEIGG